MHGYHGPLRMENLTMWAENTVENDQSFVLMIDQSESMAKQSITSINHPSTAVKWGTARAWLCTSRP